MLKATPTEVVADAATIYPGALDELIPSAWLLAAPLAGGVTGRPESFQRLVVQLDGVGEATELQDLRS